MPNRFNYAALIEGGIGDQLWEKTMLIRDAANLVEAAQRAHQLAEDMGGWLTSIQQDDGPVPPLPAGENTY